MFQADQWIEQIRSAEHGTPRMEIMKNAIAEADASAAHYWRIYFRFEYVKESIFHDDNFKAILMFPELLQVFDEHPEQEDDTYDDVMLAYKWILENMTDYYQISREEIEKYYEDYKERCQKYGFSLRVYYMKKSLFYLPFDVNASKTAYQAFHDCKRDANSDCEACEIHHDMSMALDFGNEEEALRVAAPILDGSKYCGEVPHVSYGALTRFYLYKGDLEEAAYYGKLCARYTDNEPEFLAESGYLLELYSAVEPRTGWKIFKNNVEHFVQCRNPMMRMCFARGAYRLLQCIEKETEFAESILLKPLPLHRAEEGYRVKELTAYFYDIAKQQSLLLDQRNGSNYYMSILETKLASADTADISESPANRPMHGLAAKMNSTLAAVPESGQLPEMEELMQNLGNLSKEIEVLSHSVEENTVCYLTFRFEDRVYEACLMSLETEEPIHARPCYDMDEATREAIADSSKHLLLHMEYSDDPRLSCHLAMHLLHILLPDMLGVIDLITQKMYPARWVKFAGSCRNAVSPSDLFSLSINGTDDSDEVWITTLGLCTAGLRELEIVGANRENFGYFADILHFIGCTCMEQSMLEDEMKPISGLRVHGEECIVTWTNPDKFLPTMPDSFAARVERTLPAGILAVLTEEEEAVLLTDFEPMAKGQDVEFPYVHSNLVRRIHLAKETVPQLRKAYAALSASAPIAQAAVRLEFTLSPEMRDQCGYGKELLWADISAIDGETIIASTAEISDLLPSIDQNQEFIVTEENITAWMIRLEGDNVPYTEEDAHYFM